MLLTSDIKRELFKWSTDEVVEWFNELNLDLYINIIKYEKITGKDIVEGDSEFFKSMLGMIEDHHQKLIYNIENVKYSKLYNQKLYVWGNNTFNQLGLTGKNSSFIRKPTKVILNPDIYKNNDYIANIYCGKTYSIILTKTGKIFITGNYKDSNKNLNEINNIKSDIANTNINSSKDSCNKSKSKKERKISNSDYNKAKENKDETSKRFSKNNINKDLKKHDNVVNMDIECNTNKWVNITNFINPVYEGYYRIKNIYIYENLILTSGFSANEVPYNRQIKKVKFKHGNDNNKKFDNIYTIIDKLKAKLGSLNNCYVVYENPNYGLLQYPLLEFVDLDIPYYKITKIKNYSEVVWDRKLRYYKYQ